MKCSFDKEENCPLEHFNKGNTHWKLNSTQARNPLSFFQFTSNSKSGKNHYFMDHIKITPKNTKISPLFFPLKIQ